MNRLLFNISKRFASKCGKDCSKCPLNKNLKLELQKMEKERLKQKFKKIIEIQSVPRHNYGNDFMRGNLYYN